MVTLHNMGPEPSEPRTTCLLMRRRRRGDVGVDIAVTDGAAIAAVVVLFIVALGPLRALLLGLGAAVPAAHSDLQLALVHLGLGMFLFTQSQ